MKKLIVVLLCGLFLLLLCATGSADVLFNSDDYSMDELLSIYSYVSKELDGYIRIPAGVYVVGSDLPAGRYTVLPNTSVKENTYKDFCHVAVFDSMDAFNKDPYNFFDEGSLAIRSCNTAWKGINCELLDGMVLVVKMGKMGLSRVNNQIFDQFWDKTISRGDVSESKVVIANGTFDIDSYTKDDLISIYNTVEQKAFDCVFVPAGIYEVGKDLPIGRYSVLSNNDIKDASFDNFSHVAIFNTIDEYNKDPDNFFGEESLAVRSCNTAWEGFSTELKDGMLLVVKMGQAGVTKTNSRIFDALWEDSDLPSESEETSDSSTNKKNVNYNIYKPATTNTGNNFALSDNNSIVGFEELSLQPDNYEDFKMAVCVDQVNQKIADPDYVSEDGRTYYYILAQDKCKELLYNAVPISLGPDSSVLWASSDGGSLYVQHGKVLVALMQASNRGAKDNSGLLENTLRYKFSGQSNVVNGDTRWSPDGRYLFFNDTEKWSGILMSFDDPYLVDTYTGEIFLLETDGKEKRIYGDEDIQFVLGGRFSNDENRFDYCLKKGTQKTGWSYIIKRYDLLSGEIKEIYESADSIIDFCEMGFNQWMIVSESESRKEIIRVWMDNEALSQECRAIDAPDGSLCMFPISDEEALIVVNNSWGQLSTFAFVNWNEIPKKIDWYMIPESLSGQMVEKGLAEIDDIVNNLTVSLDLKSNSMNYAYDIARVIGTDYVLIQAETARKVPDTWDNMYQPLVGLVALNTVTKVVSPINILGHSLRLGDDQSIYDGIVLIGSEALTPSKLLTGTQTEMDHYIVNQLSDTIFGWPSIYFSSRGTYQYKRSDENEVYIYPYGIETKNIGVSSVISIDGDTVNCESLFEKTARSSGYLLPEAIRQDRFLEFLERMEKIEKKKLKLYYTLYEPEKLNKERNTEDIIVSYPGVQSYALYILKDGLNDSTLESIAGYFAKANYTKEDYETDQAEVANSMFSNSIVEYRLLLDSENPCTSTLSLQLAGLCDMINSSIYKDLSVKDTDDYDNIINNIRDKYIIDSITYCVKIKSWEKTDESIKMVFTTTVPNGI